jgi:methylated-DNA-[protein]-cysteine S-methyltransferase
MEAYWAGTLRSFSIPLDLQGSPFQTKVWESLLTIPWGRTRTYLEQARALGDEKAIRAVASANGRNPVAIVVPCHRVIGSDGSLTGYAGGLDRKRALLVHEGAWASAQPELGL